MYVRQVQCTGEIVAVMYVKKRTQRSRKETKLREKGGRKEKIAPKARNWSHETPRVERALPLLQKVVWIWGLFCSVFDICQGLKNDPKIGNLLKSPVGCSGSSWGALWGARVPTGSGNGAKREPNGTSRSPGGCSFHMVITVWIAYGPTREETKSR